MLREVFEPEHEDFRATVREFIDREVLPNIDRWEQNKIVDRAAFLAAGKQGLIGFTVPEEFGGGGVDDFRFNAVIGEELARAGSSGPSLTLQNVVAPYLTQPAIGASRCWW